MLEEDWWEHSAILGGDAQKKIDYREDAIMPGMGTSLFCLVQGSCP